MPLSLLALLTLTRSYPIIKSYNRANHTFIGLELTNYKIQKLQIKFHKFEKNFYFSFSQHRTTQFFSVWNPPIAQVNIHNSKSNSLKNVTLLSKKVRSKKLLKQEIKERQDISLNKHLPIVYFSLSSSTGLSLFLIKPSFDFDRKQNS